MNEERAELDVLQNPESWDWEQGETHPGNPDAAVELVVRFAGPEFRAVAAAARQAGLSSIQFVHKVAVKAAQATAQTP
jgi:hypothetical protein